jgi:hypothetical protein
MNERITITDNWDGTRSVSLDGEVVLERKSHEECRTKALFLDTYLAVGALTEPELKKIVDTP